MGTCARWRAAVASASALVALACATPNDPFRTPAKGIRERVHTIALLPIAVGVALDDADRVRALIEPRVLSMLREGGYEVIPPEEWDRRWLVIAREIGPIWDPVTGKRDEQRYEAARSALYHELAHERGVDAIMLVAVVLEPLEASGTSPLLCGIQRNVYWPDDTLSLRTRVTSAYGACLSARMFDMDNREIYVLERGIEWEETYALQTHARRPLDQRLRDRQQIEEALAVLGPIVAREK